MTTTIGVAYRPLVFPELGRGEDPRENRVTRSMLIQKMEAEANAKFLKDGIISPFEDTLKSSDKEEFDTGDFVIEIGEGSGKGSTSWAKVHSRLSEYLDVRADDSRAASFEGVRYFEGVGYCLRVEDLQNHIGKLIKEETSKPSGSRSLKWPSKARGEEYPTEVELPDKSFYRITRENGRAVLQAKRVVLGIAQNVVKPYNAELQRWFEANTGYHPPKNIPDKELGHDERIVEFVRGSYGRVQLVREETPKYKEALTEVQGALKDMRDMIAVKIFRSTNDEDGRPYVNIKSVRNYLTMESMGDAGFVEVGSRYNITP